MSKSLGKFVCCFMALILFIGAMTGCGSEDMPSSSGKKKSSSGGTIATDPVPTDPEPTVTTVPVPVISPDTVGFYIPAGDGTKARIFIDELRVGRTAKVDIDCFEVIASREDYLSGSSFYGIWSSAWNSHENAQNSKIGFRISFTLTSGEEITKTLLKPGDSAEFYDYLEIYMYDDINNANVGFYSHLEDSQMNDATIISSIKLTSGSRIHEVGDIVLTAFIYTGQDCFDEDGNYIGNVTAVVRIPAQQG